MLPSWAIKHEDGRIEVDPDVVYPLFLDALGYVEITQEALETCRMCFTRYLHNLEGGTLYLVITTRPRWALRNFPNGIALDHISALDRLTAEGTLPK